MCPCVALGLGELCFPASGSARGVRVEQMGQRCSAGVGFSPLGENQLSWGSPSAILPALCLALRVSAWQESCEVVLGPLSPFSGCDPLGQSRGVLRGVKPLK